MKKLITAAALAVALPATAMAQESDAERAAALQQCLIEVSGPAEKETIRNLLKALLDEDIEQVQTLVYSVFERLAVMAVEDCGAPTDITSQAWAGHIPGSYIEAMTVNAFAEAIDALGNI